MRQSELATGHTLIMTRRFSAPQALVFAAISQPHHMQQWMCPEEFGVSDLEADVRVGGRFRIEMRSADGSIVTTKGEYLAVDPPHRLVFSWQWEPGHTMAGVATTVNMELVQQGAETLLTMTHYGLSSEQERASHAQGWTGAYEKLRKLLDV